MKMSLQHWDRSALMPEKHMACVPMWCMSGQQHLSEQLISVSSTYPIPDAHVKQLFTHNGRAVIDRGLSKCSRNSNRASPPNPKAGGTSCTIVVPPGSLAKWKKGIFYMLQQQKCTAKANVFLRNSQAKQECKISLTHRHVWHLESTQQH